VSAGTAPATGEPLELWDAERLQQRLGDRRVHRPVNAAWRALLLIRRVRPSGEEEPPDDDGQDDDDTADTPGPTAGLPASAGPNPDVAYVPANCVARAGV